MEVWARFDFHRGSCHRCERTDLPVACLGTMEARGVTVNFMACHWCIFRIEQLHWIEAERARLRAGGKPSDQQPQPHPPTRRQLCVPGVPLRVRRLSGRLVALARPPVGAGSWQPTTRRNSAE